MADTNEKRCEGCGKSGEDFNQSDSSPYYYWRYIRLCRGKGRYSHRDECMGKFLVQQRLCVGCGARSFPAQLCEKCQKKLKAVIGDDEAEATPLHIVTGQLPTPQGVSRGEAELLLAQAMCPTGFYDRLN